jgi:Uma2 family endonuclease
VEVVKMALPQVLEQQRETKRLQWEDYVQMPPKGEHAEIVDGEVVPLAGASAKHQQVVVRLCALLYADEGLRQQGAILTAPFDVVIQREPLRVRQPDVLYVRYDKLGGAELLDSLTHLEMAPDLVVEVLSPNDTLERLHAKLADYHTLGVPEVWLVDLTPDHVFVLTHKEEDWHWHQPVSGEEVIPSQQLPSLQIPAKAVFEG